MNDTSGLAPKDMHAFMVLHIVVPPGWTGRSDLVEGIEKLMMAEDASQAGPGGAVLHSLFIQIPPDGAGQEVLERYRQEYPIRRSDTQPKPWTISCIRGESSWGWTTATEAEAEAIRADHLLRGCSGDHQVKYVTG